MTVSMSIVNNRWRVGRYLRKIAVSKEYGMIDNVKITKVRAFIWHLRFDVELNR